MPVDNKSGPDDREANNSEKNKSDIREDEEKVSPLNEEEK